MPVPFQRLRCRQWRESHLRARAERPSAAGRRSTRRKSVHQPIEWTQPNSRRGRPAALVRIGVDAVEKVGEDPSACNHRNRAIAIFKSICVGQRAQNDKARPASRGFGCRIDQLPYFCDLGRRKSTNLRVPPDNCLVFREIDTECLVISDLTFHPTEYPGRAGAGLG
jgi:hypothetical protein